MGRSTHSLEGHFSSSGDESTDIDSSNEVYTSGTINTDDEPGSLSCCLETEQGHRQCGVENPIGQQVGTTSFDPTRETAPSPGSGYSLEDYAPLSTLVQNSGKVTATKESSSET